MLFKNVIMNNTNFNKNYIYNKIYYNKTIFSNLCYSQKNVKMLYKTFYNISKNLKIEQSQKEKFLNFYDKFFTSLHRNI